MVKLVGYADSSDDERDDSQWSDLSPPSPSDSLSYPMRSPESEDDEDYAPSDSSPDSDTQSVDTEDLDPHEEMDDETLEDTSVDVIDLTQTLEDVQDEWTELQMDNPFKRRNVVDTMEDAHWSSQPSSKEQFFSRESATKQQEKPVFNSKLSTVEIPQKTSSFTFLNTQKAEENSASPHYFPTESFNAGEGGFTIGRSGKTPKPYKFAARTGPGVSVSRKMATSTDDGDDTMMPSPSPQVKTPKNGEFLFGQGYKTRKTFVIPRQNSQETSFSTGTASDPLHTAVRTKGSLWTAKVPDADTSTSIFGSNSEPTVASASFSTGIPGPNTHHRHSDRRKKKPSSSSVFTTQTERNASVPVFKTSSSTPSATYPRAEMSFIHPVAETSANSRENHPRTTPSTVPSSGTTNGSFVFGTGSTNSFTGANSSPFSTSNSGSIPAMPSTEKSAQFLFGNGTSHEPFEFQETETNVHSEPPSSQLNGISTSNANFGSFTIGSAETKKNSRFVSRVRPRKGGMFTNKNSPRKGVKVGEGEPEPSPNSTSSPSESPFGIHNRRNRKNARLRHTYNRSPPADPFVTPTFHNYPSSTPFVSKGNDAVRPLAKKSDPCTFGASDNSVSTGVEEKPTKSGVSFQPQQTRISQSQDLNRRSSLQTNKSQQQNEGGTRPALAGSRRILRAALRGVGVRNDRASSAPLTSYRTEEGDAEMDSQDDDWLELKRLGGIAYSSKQYEKAAEYYRESYEVLEALLLHNERLDTPEIRTDKAKLHANRAACLMSLMQLTEAQNECQRSITADATYARAYLRLGRIQVLLGKTAQAQANLDTAKQLMEGDGEVSKDDHNSVLKMEEIIKTLTKLQSEIKWYMDCGDFNQALELTETALTFAPSCRTLQVQKARILLHQKKFDEIVEFCTSIVKLHVTSRGKTLRSTNGRALKDKTIGKVVGIDLGLLWAKSLHYQNKVDDAVSILNELEAVALCSSNVVQLKRQWEDMKKLKEDGNDRFRCGEHHEAVRLYSEAVQIDPQHHEYCAIIYCNRAAAQMSLERYHTAILDCNEALQRKPQFPRALLRRARCHVALKMFHEAVKDFDSYLREQPNDLPAKATADVRRERNEAKAAIAKAREEAKQRETAKKRAEREQRQRRSNRSEEPSWEDNNRFYANFRRGSSNANTNGSNRYQSSGTGSRASFMAPKTQRRTHYDVLGIEKTATGDQIKKAYRKLALVYHPDKAKTSTHAELFKEMTAAYNVLSDLAARAKYDQELVYNRFGNFYEN